MAAGGWLKPGPGPGAAGPWPRLALTALAVLLLHAAALTGVARLAQAQGSQLKAMEAPLFTRLLAPEAPAQPPQPKPAARPTQTAQPAITSIAKQARAPASAARAAAPAARPSPAPPAMAEAPEAVPPAASAEADRAGPVATLPPLPALPPDPFQVGPTADVIASTPGASVTGGPSPTLPATSATLATTADGWPADTRLNYRVSGHYRGPLYGRAAVSWLRQADDYQAQVDIDISLVPRQLLTSQGQVTDEGLRPRIYEELRFNKRRAARLGERDIQFEGGRSAPRPDGVQDTASQFVELTRRFATGREALAVGHSISVWLARPGGVDRWTYDVAALERLATPQLGEVEAFHLVPRPLDKPRGPYKAEMWFAPSLQYLPVRIRVSMGDEAHVDLMVDTIEQQ